MITAGNRALDENTCVGREQGGEAVWLVNNKGKVCTSSKRGGEVIHIRFINLPLVLHKAFRNLWKRIIRLGNR